ncbi:MAG: class F sortase [Candidatus Paceibacterota bacterium]
MEHIRPASSETILTALTMIAVILAIAVGAQLSTTGGNSHAPLTENTADRPVTSPGYATTSLPVRIEIPELGVDAEIEHVSVTASGNMATPSTYQTTAWYKYGAVPGARGNAVIAGHLDNSLSLPGVFYHLEELGIGDLIYITNENGDRLIFEVVRTETYPYNDAPIETIFGTSTERGLNLTTCSGDWLDSANTYQDRFVVFTTLLTAPGE